MRAMLAALLAAASACQWAGPRTIESGRGRYNEAIARTNDEQLLLNLVRLRYRDTPYFLEVASISSSLRVAVSSEIGAGLQRGPDLVSLLGVASLAEEPTVTYTPLRGEDFVKHLLTPVEPTTLLLLYHSGWSIERLFRVCVQSAGGLPNAPSASGPTPVRPPEFERFQRATRRLRELQLAGDLELGAPADGGAPGLVLRVAPEARGSQPARELAALLGLDPDRADHLLTSAADPARPGAARFVTRSLMAVLFYLSQGVEVPVEDEARGRVTVTRDEAGERFAWSRLTGGLFRVQVGDSRPPAASVATRYRGAWFYVGDSDLESKSTFALLAQLFALQSGGVPSSGPVLTLPVAR